MQRGELSNGPAQEVVPEASATFKKMQLRLLMKEREDVVSRLVEMDYTIWVLEEYFRSGNP